MIPVDSHWTIRVHPGALQVSVPEGFRIHARPAVLIARVVAFHRAAVELEVGGRRCNPAAIIQLLVTLGSVPDARELTFRGEDPVLRDLEALFQYELGERGLDQLPASLHYLQALDEWYRDERAQGRPRPSGA